MTNGIKYMGPWEHKDAVNQADAREEFWWIMPAATYKVVGGLLRMEVTRRMWGLVGVKADAKLGHGLSAPGRSADDGA